MDVSETDFKRGAQRLRVSNLYVATRPDVCQQIGRKGEKSGMS